MTLNQRWYYVDSRRFANLFLVFSQCSLESANSDECFLKEPKTKRGGGGRIFLFLRRQIAMEFILTVRLILVCYSDFPSESFCLFISLIWVLFSLNTLSLMPKDKHSLKKRYWRYMAGQRVAYISYFSHLAFFCHKFRIGSLSREIQVWITLYRCYLVKHLLQRLAPRL